MERERRSGMSDSFRDRIARINHEAWTGFSWDMYDEEDKEGAYNHADQILTEFEKLLEGMRKPSNSYDNAIHNACIDSIKRRLRE